MRSLTTSTLSEVGVVMIEEYVVCGVNMYVNVYVYILYICMYVKIN